MLNYRIVELFVYFQYIELATKWLPIYMAEFSLKMHGTTQRINIHNYSFCTMYCAFIPKALAVAKVLKVRLEEILQSS